MTGSALSVVSYTSFCSEDGMAMGVARKTGPDTILIVEIDFGHCESNSFFRNSDGDTPRIDDHGFAKTMALSAVVAMLPGSQNPTLVFYCSGPKQRLPMVFSGEKSEGGRTCQYLCACSP